MNIINLPMSKWATNSTGLRNLWKADDVQYHSKTQVLGVRWDTDADSLSIDPSDIMRPLPTCDKTSIIAYHIKIVRSFGTVLTSFTYWKDNVPRYIDQGDCLERNSTT